MAGHGRQGDWRGTRRRPPVCRAGDAISPGAGRRPGVVAPRSRHERTLFAVAERHVGEMLLLDSQHVVGVLGADAVQQPQGSRRLTRTPSSHDRLSIAPERLDQPLAALPAQQLKRSRPSGCWPAMSCRKPSRKSASRSTGTIADTLVMIFGVGIGPSLSHTSIPLVAALAHQRSAPRAPPAAKADVLESAVNIRASRGTRSVPPITRFPPSRGRRTTGSVPEAAPGLVIAMFNVDIASGAWLGGQALDLGGITAVALEQ